MVFGLGRRRERSTFNVWDEGKAPDVVLGLDPGKARRDGAPVLAMRRPRTDKEFDGAVEDYERQRRIAEARASAAEDDRYVAEDRLSTAWKS